MPRHRTPAPEAMPWEKGRKLRSCALSLHGLAPVDCSRLTVVELARIRFVENDRHMSGNVEKPVDEVLKIDPRQSNAHGLLGFGTFSAGNYQRAIDHWRIAIAGTESESNQEALRQMMAAVRARMGSVDNEPAIN